MPGAAALKAEHKSSESPSEMETEAELDKDKSVPSDDDIIYDCSLADLR